MPISSHQVAGFIGGQNAMFGNYSSYAQQITPGSHGMPTYPNPMGGVDPNMGSTPWDMPGAEGFGTRATSFMGNVGLPALGTAALLGGSMLPGALGRGIGMLDPFSAGVSGFARGAGLRAGGQGIMANLGRIAGGGFGSIARAGVAGLGGAAIAAAPIMALGAAAHYGVGQMVQGGQFENQGGAFLNQNFRHLNPMSDTGFGFGRQGVGQIMDVVREMGNKEIMSSPQEMLRVMQAGTGMGVFRAVQDAKQFNTKFKEMVGALKEVATTMNTTLEGAVPFLAQARQMGFWTPQDISRHAQMTKQTAAATGMTVAQTQQMMSQGAGMARQIGARGYAGAEGMARTMQLVGGAVRGGALSEEQLSEITGGLQGPEAIQALSGTMQASATRFASGRTARWLLAGLGRNNFQNLDQGKLSALMSGSMSIGEIGSSARGNIGKQGAFNFVMNERRLREELVRRGPEAQFGLLRGLVGGSLYDESSKGQYISRRVIQRFMGGNAEQADATAKLLREMPSIMRENEQRSSALADQEVRNRNQLMDHSWEGLKRKAMDWFRGNVQEPMQKFGAEVSRSLSHTYEEYANKLFGTAQGRYRFRGIEKGALQALQTYALGSDKQYVQQFASQDEMRKFTAAPTGGGGLTSMFQPSSGMGNLPTALVQSVGERISAAQTGSLTERGASELGFQNVGAGTKMLESARKEMGGVEYRGQAFLFAQRTGLKGMDLARRLVQEVQAGRMGGGALKELVRGGGEQAAYRMAAAQTQELRESMGGINLTPESEGLGVLSGMGSTARETEISRRLEAAEGDIARAAGEYNVKGRGLTSAIQKKNWASHGDVSALVEKGGGELRSILTKFGAGRTPEEREENSKKARAELAALAGNKKFSEKEQKILASMADPNGPGNKQMSDALGKYGENLRVRNYFSSSEAISLRMGRFKDSMRATGKQSEIMAGLDKVGDIGSVVRTLTETVDPKGFTDRLGQLVQAAGAADPAQAARAADLLQGHGGGEEMVAAIREGSAVGQAARALTSRSGKLRDRVLLAQNFARQMGADMQITTGEMKALEAGGTKAEKAQSAILARMGDRPAEQKEHAAKMLQAIRDKSETSLRTLGQAGATSRAIGLMGTPETDLFQRKTVELRRSLGSGQVGSPQGIHTTLNDIKVILSEISKKGGGTGMGVAEKPDDKKGG